MTTDEEQKLIAIKEARLQELEAQAAYYGPRTEPAVLMEIDQLKAEIRKLRGESLAPPGPRLKLSGLPVSGAYLFGRERELARLDAAWEQPETNIFSLVAWGGVGKTALVNRWLTRLAGDGNTYRGAERLYAWSFYSQGADQERHVSADLFIDHALRWFGHPDPATIPPGGERGQALADLVRGQPTLLILDGLEPLQTPPGPDEGRLVDPALQALLGELGYHNPGLLLITTRLPVADLDRFQGNGADRLDLERLSPAAGAALLEALGAQGTAAEREEAAAAFGGHALALTLLGGYLRDRLGGDIRRWREVGDLLDEERQGGHARRVMAAYAQWFRAEAGRDVELALLHLLGLFDRPAEPDCLAALRQPPPIPGLTDPFFVESADESGWFRRIRHIFSANTASFEPISERRWEEALSRLRRAGLIAEERAGENARLDAHPLVRTYFGEQLERNQPEAWRAGHDRLYRHLAEAAPHRPDTLREMAPLYAAVGHGCRAGKHQEALDEIFWARISRGNEHFSTRKLGAFGADLAALAHLFADPWRRPHPALSAPAQAFVLNEAGFALRALGRLGAARQPMRAGLEARIEQEDWRNAAIAAGNLSELSLAVGEIEAAVEAARQAVALADRSEDWDQRVATRTILADALHQAGRTAEAAELFEAAEAMQRERQPQYPRLYSLQGYQYCDLLLGRGRVQAQKVRERAAETLEWVTTQNWLLDMALDTLSLGLAWLIGPEAEPRQAEEHLNRAVAGLRRAGTQDYLPRGLLARAELFIGRGEEAAARRDLAEALALAERGGMRLHECDAHLGYARLHLAAGRPAEAARSLAEARRLVAETGYHRRDPALADLARRIEGA